MTARRTATTALLALGIAAGATAAVVAHPASTGAADAAGATTAMADSDMDHGIFVDPALDPTAGSAATTRSKTAAAPRSTTDVGYHRFSGYAGATGNNGKLVLQLIESPGVESFRDAARTVAAELTAVTGLQVTVASGTTTSTAPVAGVDKIRVASNHYGQPMCGSWGCGGPTTFQQIDGGWYITGGRVTVAPSTVRITATEKVELLAHEIGHTLGLDHYNGTFQGHYQRMNGYVDKEPGLHYQAGDKAGLKAVTPLVRRPAPFGLRTHDLTGDRRGDLVGLTADGTVRLYRAQSTGTFSAPTVVTTDVPATIDQLDVSGDLTGDDRTDLIVRAGGKLYVLGMDLGGNVTRRIQVGTSDGWNYFTTILAPGDIDGDGNSDLLGLAADGTLYRYSGDGAGGFAEAAVVGTGWDRYARIAAVGDFDGDRRNDIVGRTADGHLWLRSGNGAGGFRAEREIGHGFGPTLVGIGDLTGDGKADLLHVRSDGVLYRIAGTGTGGFTGASVQVGHGWTTVTAE